MLVNLVGSSNKDVTFLHLSTIFISYNNCHFPMIKAKIKLGHFPDKRNRNWFLNFIFFFIYTLLDRITHEKIHFHNVGKMASLLLKSKIPTMLLEIQPF